MRSMAGPAATPTIGVLVRDHKAAGGIQISASHNPPDYNGLKFFQRGRHGVEPGAGDRLARSLAASRFSLGGWDSLGTGPPARRSRSGAPDARALDRRRRGDPAAGIHGRARRLPRCGRPARGRRLLQALGCRAIVLGGQPDGRYDHPPEPTEANLKEFAAIVPAIGAAVGFAQDPDADRLAIVDETGRYIGEELTLALAACATARASERARWCSTCRPRG